MTRKLTVCFVSIACLTARQQPHAKVDRKSHGVVQDGHMAVVAGEELVHIGKDVNDPNPWTGLVPDNPNNAKEKKLDR
jgi:hypothetical protein